MLLCSQRNCLFISLPHSPACLPFRNLWLGKIMELNSIQCVTWNSPCGLNFTFFSSLSFLSFMSFDVEKEIYSPACLLRLFISYCCVFYFILCDFFVVCYVWHKSNAVLRSIRSLWWDLMKDHPLLIILTYIILVLIAKKLCFLFRYCCRIFKILQVESLDVWVIKAHFLEFWGF